MIDLSWGAATHAGRVREHNEDSLLAVAPAFVVADGMGGHQAGEIASAIAVDHFRGFTGETAFGTADVAAALAAANIAIVGAGSAGQGRTGMGTTVVGLIAVEEAGQPYWLAFNIGDSRLYSLSRGELAQISVDHSYVQELVNAGRLSTDDARAHPDRNVVTRALGQLGDIQPDFWMMPVEPDERFLLCSDGLSGDVEPDRIRDLLLAQRDPAEAASELVAAALRAGGRDNITVIVVDVRDVHTGSEIEDTTPRWPNPYG